MQSQPEGVAVCFGGVVDSNIASIVHVFSCAMGCWSSNDKILYGLKTPPKVPQHGVSSGPIVLSGGWISRVKNPMKWQMPGICVIGAVNIGPKILRRYSEMARQSRSIVGYHPTGPRAPGTSVAQPRDTTYRIARCYEFTIVKLSHPQNKLREPFPFFDSSASSCSTKSSTCSQADCWISTMEPWQFPSLNPVKLEISHL